MRSRAFTLSLVALVSLVSAGCVGIDGLTGASTSGGGNRADQMLASPPWADVQPTGVTREFDLYLHRMEHELYPMARMSMWGFSLSDDPATATVPGPTLRVTEGDTVVVNLRSTIAGFNHTLHMHGQHVPWDQDGVAFVSQKPAEAGETFTYTFMAKPAGTYWYHCHVDAQHHIDMGMYGVLIVDPQDPTDDPRSDKEFVMVLDDMDRFHLEGGQPATQNAPQNGDPETYEEWLRRQAGDTVNRNPAVADRITGTPIRQTRDWYPVTYAPYSVDYNTFLINGVAFPYTETLVVDEGDVIRIRLVNVGNSMMSMHLHGHHMLVTHKDGIRLDSPYWVDTVVIGPAERYDLHVKMDNPGIWEMHDHFGGHTQNDDIFPGGAMTMLCYSSMEGCEAGGGHSHASIGSGDLLMWRWKHDLVRLP